MHLLSLLSDPWPWYIAGPLIGLIVPILLLLGNKSFGISSSLRHICAACMPANIPYFKYDWKREVWNLVFAGGIVLGGIVTSQFLSNPNPVDINPVLLNELKEYGINDYRSLMPADLFNWNNLLTAKGLMITVAGGFLIGFGTRYAGGCTSGHSIMGLSNLQLSSLIATICFMIGGFIMANLFLPYILKW